MESKDIVKVVNDCLYEKEFSLGDKLAINYAMYFYKEVLMGKYGEELKAELEKNSGRIATNKAKEWKFADQVEL